MKVTLRPIWQNNYLREKELDRGKKEHCKGNITARIRGECFFVEGI